MHPAQGAYTGREHSAIIRRSVCPYDCPDACGLLVEVEGGRAVRASGDPEHPFTRGFLCPKMRHYERTVHSPQRLTTPLVRTGPKGSGPKGSGNFRPVSWEEAIGLIAGRWRQIIERHGAEAILPYSYAGTMGLIQRNAGHPFFHRLGASRLERTICSPAKKAGWKAVMGNTRAPHPDEVMRSDLVILWGINAAATSIHFLRGVREAKKRGAKVWLIDTYRTPTAAVADEIFLVRPGSDGALTLGLMHLLARDGRLDENFLKERVQGFEELRQRILPDYPPEKVSALTGLPVTALEAMAAAYGAARAPFIRLGSGLSRYGNGAMTVRTIASLPALVGAYGKPGGGCFCGTSTSAAFALSEVTREDFMARPTRLVNMNLLGQALTKLEGPPVHALYVYHSNPAVVAPDQNAVLRGLEREDLFTVVHERFLTDTASYADVVLPAASSLETSDLYNSYGTYCIQRARPVIPLVGQSKSNWDTFALLAKAMGFTEPFFSQSADDLIDRLLAIPSPWLEHINTALLADGRTVELPVPAAEGFGTPSGRIEILNTAESEPLPRYIPSYAAQEDLLPLRLMTAPSLFSLNSTFYEQTDLRKRQGGMRLLLHPEEAKIRALSGGQMVTAFNSLGEVNFLLETSERVPPGVAVAEGVWWLEHAPGLRTVNALTSQRLTDRGGGSTFYDNAIDVRPAS